MKLVLLIAALAITAQSAVVQKTTSPRLPLSFQLKAGGPYDDCVAILEKILLETNEIAAHIINKEWTQIVPLAIKLGRDIYDDIVCFQKPHIDESSVSLPSEDPTECIIKHIKAAAEALQSAIEEAQAQHWKEAARYVLIAIAHIHEAQQCK